MTYNKEYKQQTEHLWKHYSYFATKIQKRHIEWLLWQCEWMSGVRVCIGNFYFHVQLSPWFSIHLAWYRATVNQLAVSSSPFFVPHTRTHTHTIIAQATNQNNEKSHSLLKRAIQIEVTISVSCEILYKQVFGLSNARQKENRSFFPV